MMSDSPQLRQRIEQGIEGIRVPHPDSDAVLRKALHRRATRRKALGLTLSLLAVVAILTLGSPVLADVFESTSHALFGTGRAPAPQFVSQSPEGDVPTTFVDTRYGVSLDVPPGWTLTSDPLPVITDPRTLARASSVDVGAGDFCAAARDLPPNGVVVDLIERFDLSDGDPSVYAAPAGSLHWADSEPTIDCGGDGNLTPSLARFQFSAESRAFEAWIAVGPEAHSQDRDAALALVNSLKVVS